MSACIRMIWPNRACRLPPARPSTALAAPIFCWLISEKTANAPSTACCPARCTLPILRSTKAYSPAACCARWPGRADGVSCSSVLSASAPRWRSSPPSNQALRTPRISPAASTPGKRPADRSLPADPPQLVNKHVQRLGQVHATAFGQSFRNDDAPARRIEALKRRMQQESLAVITRALAGLRHQDEIRLC